MVIGASPPSSFSSSSLLRQFFPLPNSWILTEVRLRARKMDVSVSSFNRRSPLLLLFQSVARCWRFSCSIRVRWYFRRKLGVGGLDTFAFGDLWRNYILLRSITHDIDVSIQSIARKKCFWPWTIIPICLPFDKNYP